VKIGALLFGDLLEPAYLIETSQVLREDDVTPASEVGRRHRQCDRPQDIVHVIVCVLPPTHQPVQAVDIQVEGAGIPFRTEGGDRGFPDSRRTIHVNEGRH
jgi:hypothetical protein